MKMIETLLAKADEHQRLADALRLAATELNGHATTKKQARGMDATLDGAVALRREQQTAAKTSRPAQNKQTLLLEQRTKTANFLATFGDTPRNDVGRIAAPLAFNGYLRKTAAGWVRTTKPFEVTPSSKTSRQDAAPVHVATPRRYSPSVIKQRKKTAQLLAKFGEHPLVIKMNVTGALVRRGYLRHTPEGFIRTDKPFVVEHT